NKVGIILYARSKQVPHIYQYDRCATVHSHFYLASASPNMRFQILPLLCKHCLHRNGRWAMAKQGVHPSGRVVSVRLDEEPIKRLDNLSERTGRSRGFYLKLAIRAMLPAIEQKHWEHAAAQFEEDGNDRRFREIMTQALEADNDQK